MLEIDLSCKAEINLYYDLSVPDNREQSAPLLLAVHGYGAHKRYMMREAQLIAPADFVIASVQAPYPHFRETGGGYKTGFGWLTDYKPEESIALHHNFLLELVEKLRSQNVIDTNKIYLYGFSQACALNFRFAFTYPELFRGVIGVCGGIPSDLETNELYKHLPADVFYLYAMRDEFYPLEKYQTFKEKLKKRLNIFTSKGYDAKHEITDEMRNDIKTWLKGR
jgi:phospholipase/carboxylesterase